MDGNECRCRFPLKAFFDLRPLVRSEQTTGTSCRVAGCTTLNITNTQLLLIVIAGLYVAESASSALQIAWFKATGRRIFRMAPIHHHFELAGWPETTVVVRLWIVAGIGVALGLGLFYSDFIRAGGLF